MDNDLRFSDLPDERTGDTAGTSQDRQTPGIIDLVEQAHDLATSASNAVSELQRCKRSSKQKPVPRLRTYVDSLLDETSDFLVTLNHAFSYSTQEQQRTRDECRCKILGAQQQLVDLLLEIDAYQQPTNNARSDTPGRASSSVDPGSGNPETEKQSTAEPAWFRGFTNCFTRKRSEQTPSEIANAREKSKKRSCAVCTDDKPADQFCTARYTSQCSHEPNCCIDCLQSWLRSNFEDNNWTHATCPECHSTLSYHETQRLADPGTFTRYDDLLTRQVLGQDDAFQWCMNPRCSSGHVHIDNNPRFECEACGNAHCLYHRVPWHEGQSCEDFDRSETGRRRQQRQAREKEASEDVVDRISKPCPNRRCGARIHKRSGCDHMTCTACGQEFCWICLADWFKVLRHGPDAHGEECRYHSNNLLHDARARAEAVFAGTRLGEVRGLGPPAPGPWEEWNLRGDMQRAFRQADDIFATLERRMPGRMHRTGGFGEPGLHPERHAPQAASQRSGRGGPPTIEVGRPEPGPRLAGRRSVWQPGLPHPEPRPQNPPNEALPHGNEGEMRGRAFPFNSMNALTGHGMRRQGPPAQLRPLSPDTWPGSQREAQRTTNQAGQSRAHPSPRHQSRDRSPRTSRSNTGRPRHRSPSPPLERHNRPRNSSPIAQAATSQRSRIVLLAREIEMGHDIDELLTAIIEQEGGMTAEIMELIGMVVPRSRDNEALSAGRRSSDSDSGDDDTGEDGEDWDREDRGRVPGWW